MKKTLLALAMLGSFGAATNAQAYAYAVSYDDVSNFLITGTGVTILNPVTNNSNALACLPNGTCVATGGTNIQNAPVAQIGMSTYGNGSPPPSQPDTYITVGPGATLITRENNATSFSVADAEITSTAGLITSAKNFAEAKLMENNTANGTAGNSSIQSIVFNVGASTGTFLFEFDAKPFIRAFLSSGSGTGSVALGSLSMNINIVGDNSNPNGFTGTVFNWVPDGVGGDGTTTGTAIQGGFETKDSFTLNTSVSATPIAPSPANYNPTQCATGSGTCFSAYTNGLDRGVYTLNIVMTEKDDLSLNIPEPGSIMLLGIGLAALGGFTRRRSMRPALPA